MKIVDVATRFHKSWKRTEHDAQIKKKNFSLYWSTIIFQDTNVSILHKLNSDAGIITPTETFKKI